MGRTEKNDKTDAKEKTARYITLIPRIIKSGVFFLVVGIAYFGVFYIFPANVFSYGAGDALILVGIVVSALGGGLILGGTIFYVLVKRFLFKVFLEETAGIYTDARIALQAYLSSFKERRKNNGGNTGTTRRARIIGKIIEMPFVTITFLFVLVLVGATMHCATYVPITYEYGDYFYCISGEEAVILGLTEEGMAKQYLIIPKEIDGRKTSVGDTDIIDRRAIERKIGNRVSNFRNENLKKIFLSTETPVNRWGWMQNSVFDNLRRDSQTVFYIGEITERYSGTEGLTSLCQSNVYDFGFYGLESGKVYKKNMLTPANVAYKYNFDGAENGGYYFIDDYDGTVIEFVPPDPTRQGYVFGGWYKEKECLNVWDFETDVVPPKNAENNVWTFAETVLYAKWVAA